MDDKNKVYVGNLAYSITDEQLKEAFQAAGEVGAAIVIKERSDDGQGGRSKGFGFVTMADEEGFNKALEMDGQELEGRALKVNPARKKEDNRF